MYAFIQMRYTYICDILSNANKTHCNTCNLIVLIGLTPNNQPPQVRDLSVQLEMGRRRTEGQSHEMFSPEPPGILWLVFVIIIVLFPCSLLVVDAQDLDKHVWVWLKFVGWSMEVTNFGFQIAPKHRVKAGWCAYSQPYSWVTRHNSHIIARPDQTLDPPPFGTPRSETNRFLSVSWKKFNTRLCHHQMLGTQKPEWRKNEFSCTGPLGLCLDTPGPVLQDRSTEQMCNSLVDDLLLRVVSDPVSQCVAVKLLLRLFVLHILGASPDCIAHHISGLRCATTSYLDERVALSLTSLGWYSKLPEVSWTSMHRARILFFFFYWMMCLEILSNRSIAFIWAGIKIDGVALYELGFYISLRSLMFHPRPRPTSSASPVMGSPIFWDFRQWPDGSGTEMMVFYQPTIGVFTRTTTGFRVSGWCFAPQARLVWTNVDQPELPTSMFFLQNRKALKE